jgi:sugar lactone lactonase YvrE
MNRYILSSIVVIASSVIANGQTTDIISTLAGGGPNAVPATGANLQYPTNTAVDSSGNYYIVEGSEGGQQHRVFKVSSTGTLTVLAGNGFPGYSGDGGPATAAQLYYPGAVAVDSSDNVYIADTYNLRIRKVTASTGIITTIAGNGNGGYSGDGGPATNATIYYPNGVAVDNAGNVYIADTDNVVIRKVNTAGVISTVAGNNTSGFSGDGGPATSAQLSYPESVAVDGSGNIYIADTSNYRVRKVTSAGTISTIVGNGTPGFSGVYGIASDSAGRLFIADYANCAIRELKSGKISTVAGEGQSCGYSGDGSSATSAQLYYPFGVAVDASDNMYIADSYNLRIRKAAVGGTINTVAGNDTLYFAGSGTPATGASLYYPTGAVPDASGNVYIADQRNCIVRKVDTTGTITTLAGTPGSCGYSGDGGAATSAMLNQPQKAVADSTGNVYIADFYNCAIRKVTVATGIITTYAGNESCGYSGDGGPATSAQLFYASGLALDASNNLYIADQYNQVIRKVTSSGTISTIAGTNVAGYSGDGGLATAAELYYPEDVAVSASGNIYIADSYNQRIRLINAGVISTFAGNGATGFQADDVPAIETSLYYPMGVSVDVAGDVLIADSYNNRVRWVNGAGIIYSVAGDGSAGFFGDGGVATSAEVYQPWGVGVNTSGTIYIADYENYRIREVTAIPNINSSSYNLSFEQQSVGTFSQPQVITLTGVGATTITSFTVTGPFIESDNCPSSLASGGHCQVEVVFDPTAPGTQTGTLSIVTNSYFNNTLTIDLSGQGAYLLYTPTSINFGGVTIGKPSAVQKITYTNKSTTAVTFTSVTTNNTEFAVSSNTCTGSLAAGKSCIISLTFTPTTVGLQSTTLSVVDSDVTSPQLIPLRGTGDGTSLSASSLAFGSVVIGSTSSMSVTISNVGTKTLTNISESITGTNMADFTKTTTCGTTLAVGANCMVTVTFKPSISGAESATLTFKDNEGSFLVTLSGTGDGSSLTPSSLNFGTVTRGQSDSMMATLKNVGTATLTSIAANVTGTNSADFTFTTTCGTTLAVGASCTYTVTFKPSIVGAESASLNVTDNEGTFVVALSGTGQ